MTKKKDSKEVITATENTPSNDIFTDDMFCSEDDETIDDIVFPRLVPMNPTSKKVLDGVATFGSIIEYDENEIVATPEKGVILIPLFMTKTYAVSVREGNGKFEWKCDEPFDGKRPYEEVRDDGLHYKYELSYNLFCLKEGVDDLPCTISFKGMSRKTGTQVWTCIYKKNRLQGLPTFGRAITITPRKDKNNNGQYVVLDFKAGDRLVGPCIKQAQYWFNMLRKSQASLTEKLNESRQADSSDEGIQTC